MSNNHIINEFIQNHSSSIGKVCHILSAAHDQGGIDLNCDNVPEGVRKIVRSLPPYNPSDVKELALFVIAGVADTSFEDSDMTDFCVRYVNCF